MKKDYKQEISILIEDWRGQLTITAVCCPPRHTVSKELLVEFFHIRGNIVLVVERF